MTRFDIIGHRTHNWEWKFYKAKWLRLKLVFPPILVVNWVSSCLSFFLERLHCLLHDIFNAPTWTTTIIILKPCALYAEFQHFILRFSKISLLLQILLKEGIRGISYWDLVKFHYFCRYVLLKEGIRGESRPKRQGEDKVTLHITLISESSYRGK
jgi:hypothetical protein